MKYVSWDRELKWVIKNIIIKFYRFVISYFWFVKTNSTFKWVWRPCDYKKTSFRLIILKCVNFFFQVFAIFKKLKMIDHENFFMHFWIVERGRENFGTTKKSNSIIAWFLPLLILPEISRLIFFKKYKFTIWPFWSTVTLWWILYPGYSDKLICISKN